RPHVDSRPHPPLLSSPTRRSSDLTPVGLSKTLRSSVFARRQPIRARGAWTDFVSTSLGRALPWGGIGPLYPVSILSLVLSVRIRSEEHTSELQSRENLVCRLLLEK